MGYRFGKCEKCKYYIEHYIKKENSSYPIHNGHCINRELNPSWKHKKYQLYENCQYWESNEEMKSKHRESIKSVLRNMRKHLAHIEQILTDDL